MNVTEARAPVASDDEAVRLLERGEIRARRRPRALLFVWLWELVSSALLATPIHAWARAVFGRHPDGDALVFQPGGQDLLAWLDDDGPSLAIVLRATGLAFFLAMLAGQFVAGATIAALATGRGPAGRAPTTASTFRTAIAAFFPLFGVTALTLGVQGFLVGVGSLAGASTDHALQDRLGDARSFVARAVVVAVSVLLALAVGVVADLVRVAIVQRVATRDRASLGDLGDASLVALRAGRRSFGAAMLGWGVRAAPSLGLVYVGAVAGDAVGAAGGAALLLLFVVHQLVIALRVALRASWLANALRLLG